MKKRLQTVLAHAGAASRRKAAELIKNGKVKIDGRVSTEIGLRIDPGEHRITVNGRLISREEKKHYFMFNKPKNVISTVTDTHDRRKVTDFFRHVNARLYPVGRLDKDTTGVLIVTNDGELAHKLAHPSFEIDKEYEVKIKGVLARQDLIGLERGIRLDGRKTAPCRIRPVKKTSEGTTYRIELHEGRKRQIRRMFGSVGAKVIELKRVKYAGLTAGKLKEGQYRELSKREVERLKGLKGNKVGTG
jgi:23S rRNA pseudouridine2605 synthase